MANVMIEFYCRDCQNEAEIPEFGDRIRECPKCGSKDQFRSRFIRCTHCGEKVYVDRFTNECYECGKMYNSFGEELAPVAEWDEEDRCACFGPQ